MKVPVLLVGLAICLLASASVVSGSRRKLAAFDPPATPTTPTTPPIMATGNSGNSGNNNGYGNNGNSGNNGNNGGYGNSGNGNGGYGGPGNNMGGPGYGGPGNGNAGPAYGGPGNNNNGGYGNNGNNGGYGNNNNGASIPGFQPGFLQQNDQNDERNGLITVNSDATADVATDNLKICVAIKVRKYAAGYEPGGKIYTVDAAASNSADSFAATRYPSQAELKMILKNLEEEIARGLEKLVDFLSDNKVMHLTSDGIRIEPIYDYGCYSKGGCNYGSPMVIGYQAVVKICFEIPISRAEDLIKACIGQYSAIVIEITFAASEDRLLDGERQAIKRAVFEAARKASTVGKALAQLNDESDYNNKMDNEHNYGSGCNSCGGKRGNNNYGAYSTDPADVQATGTNNNQNSNYNNGNNNQNNNMFGFDLELVHIKCITKDNDYMRPYYSAPLYSPSGDNMITAASYNGGDYGNGYDSDAGRDYSSYCRARGIVEQVEVKCVLTVRINGESGNNFFGPENNHGGYGNNGNNGGYGNNGNSNNGGYGNNNANNNGNGGY